MLTASLVVTMTLTQSGSGVTGTMSSPFGSSQITGTVSVADVTLTADIHTHPTIPRPARVSLHVGF
jgi:hypothetical protein